MFKSLLFVTLAFAGISQASSMEVFKMYNEPNKKINAMCDQYTELTLTLNAAKTAGVAVLKNKVGGFCEIFAVENKRTFKIALKSTSCGSKIYKQAPGSQSEIEITDHETRLCEDVIPARIIVKLPGSGLRFIELYSLDQ